MSKCTCGRSPTDQCIGWHRLTEEQYQVKKKEYEEKNETTISESKRS
jgi:hypothetical protein